MESLAFMESRYQYKESNLVTLPSMDCVQGPRSKILSGGAQA